MRMVAANVVATDPADEGRRWRQGPQPLRELDEQLVAGGMAERVVDVAQAVNVEDHDRDDLARRPDLDGFLQRTEHPAAVGQAGQRVVFGVETQPVDEAGVLDGDRRVRGERLQEPHVIER